LTLTGENKKKEDAQLASARRNLITDGSIKNTKEIQNSVIA